MNTFKQFLHLAKPFWFNPNAWREWILFVIMIGFALAIVQVSVKINLWNKAFYDAIEQFNGQAIPSLLIQYLGYIGFIVAFIVLGNVVRKILFFRWRTHLTQQFTENWLNQSKAYRLQLSHEPDNPDQRIAEDCALLAEKSVDLCKYFIMNVAKLGAFISVLWQLSGVQSVHIFGKTWHIHGYLVWIALIYTCVCTIMTHLIGRKLHSLNIERQHREADYRTALVRVRDYAEQIAFYRGEHAEQQRLNQNFQAIRQNWHELIGRELRLETFSATYLRITMFIPIIATLPLYLAKTITFGDMMQARSAFSNVQDGFAWFMDYYKRIMEWAAVVSRLAHFQQALHHTPNLPEYAATTPNNDTLLTVSQFQLNQPNGTLLIRDLYFQAHAGERILLDGNSGAGKTTLLRALAGLWVYQSGNIQFNSQHRLFLPQRPYLPQGNLRQILCYPQANLSHYSDKDLHDILTQVGLAHLISQLDQAHEWQKILSGGEQQRISFARVLLVQPDILFMDETSNQLDNVSAIQLHQLLQSQLPQTLIIATSHQSVVRKLFSRTIDLSQK